MEFLHNYSRIVKILLYWITEMVKTWIGSALDSIYLFTTSA